MTLHATRDDNAITVQALSGTAAFAITLPAAEIGHFWAHLGQLLRDAEKPAQAPPAGGLPRDGSGALAAYSDAQQAYAGLGREGEYQNPGGTVTFDADLPAD